MRQNDRRRRLFKTFTACLLALAMLLSNVMGVMEVYAADVKAPTVNPVLYDATTISGGNLAKAKVKVGKKYETVIATVHVTLKGQDGTVKATLEDTPKSGTKWSVSLPKGVKVAEGDTVTVYQQIGEDKSPEVTEKAQPSKADTVTLTMPSGEIWIEQTSSNIVNEDEQAEAVQKLKDANTAIAGDIKSVKFSIDGTAHAYYEVTYTDESTSGKVEATNLTVKQVTETSRGADVSDITIVDNVIKGKLRGKAPFKDIKVQIVLRLDDKAGTFCNDGKCKTDKNSSNPVDATVDSTTGEFTYNIPADISPNDELKLGNIVGVSVKEKNKFVSCSTTTVKAPTPEKTEVKDPKKPTDAEKEKIVNAIKAAYTADGVSKLPNGTGAWNGIPAFIEFDKDGNARIISPNNVNGSWSDGTFTPKTKADGSLDVKDESNVIKIPAKDLVKNIKPEAPTVQRTDDKKSITITPAAVDSDAKKITVSYKAKDGSDKTITAEKGDTGKWTVPEGSGVTIDETTGVMTLSADLIKAGTTVSAKVTDNGFEGNDALTSDPGTLAIKTMAQEVTELGGLDPVDIKKWVGDQVDWKEGVKAKEDDKKADVDKLLEGATFEDMSDPKRSTEKSGEFTGKIKVKFTDDSELVVENQKLMVCDHVTSTTDPKLPDDAIEVELKLGEGTKVNNTDGTSINGDKENPTSYQKYKVKPGTNLKEYKIPSVNASVIDSIKLLNQDHYADPAWKDSKDGENFVVSDQNKVFTAKATKTFEVKVVPNGGKGDNIVETKKNGETFTLPKADTFQPPNDNQEFSGWKVGDDATLKKAGETITITADTEVKAIWKPIEYKVTFQAGEGASGNMDEATVTKGSEYQLPVPTFNVPENKQFAGWKVNDEAGVKGVGEKIQISGNVTLTATWEGIPVDIAFDKGDGSGTMDKKTVDKGSMYKLPESKFTPPAGKEFAGWRIDDGKDVMAVGTEMTVDGPIKLTAVYKDAPKKPERPDDSGRGHGFWFVPAPAEPEKEIGRHDRYLYGYEDKRVRPEGNITRAEAAALIARLAELDMSDKSKPDFVDTPSAWYNSAINIMVKKDLMFGDKNGHFRPGEPITRGEFARALLYIDATNDKVAPFADVKGHPFEAAINQAYGNNRISGYPDGTFRPDAYIQRAEAARILNQYANRGTTLEGMAPVAKDLIQFTDINPSHWAYCEVMEAANTHEYERVKGTQAETWLRILHDEMKSPAAGFCARK